MATILLIEEDDARPIIRHNLRREGYDVLLAVDEEPALDWPAPSRPRADLILVNLVGKSSDEAARRRAPRQGAQRA